MSEERKDQEMEKALGRRIEEKNRKPGVDPQTEALSENRVGAHARPVEGDATTRSMSNEFELEPERPDEDATTRAMSEQRKVVRRD